MNRGGGPKRAGGGGGWGMGRGGPSGQGPKPPPGYGYPGPRKGGYDDYYRGYPPDSGYHPSYQGGYNQPPPDYGSYYGDYMGGYSGGRDYYPPPQAGRGDYYPPSAGRGGYEPYDDPKQRGRGRPPPPPPPMRGNKSGGPAMKPRSGGRGDRGKKPDPRRKRDPGRRGEGDASKSDLESKRAPLPTVLSLMQEKYTEGPMQILSNSFNNHVKVKVLLRNYKEIKAFCTGYITSFDKHWNMTMEDVDQVTIRPKKQKIPYLDVLNGLAMETQPSDANAGGEKDCTEAAKSDEKESKEVSSSGGEKDSQEASSAEGEKDSKEVSNDVQMQSDEKGDVSKESVEKASEVTEENAQVPQTSEEKCESKSESTSPSEEDISVLVPYMQCARGSKNWKKSCQIIKCHYNKLFVRGDNVVLVSLVQ